MRLYQKTCLITGCSRGIGKAVAKRFVSEGATVYANARTAGSLDEFSLLCKKEHPGELIPLYFDITNVKALKEAVMSIKKKEGAIDILVNNAAVEYNEKIGMITREHMEAMFEVNVLAVIETLQFVARVMMRSGKGSIVNLSSITGVYGNAGQLAYSATKGAVISLTKSAAKELAANNIRVNAVAPGLTDTGMMDNTHKQFLDKRLERIAMHRPATPEEVANACLFLASDEASYISGQILGVDGCGVI